MNAANVSAAQEPHREGLKETIESIVIALILAFVFRAFIVEAFVIPTGSMAPTLYGAHGTVVCQDCGTEFAYGLKDLADPRELRPVRPDSSAICPNCDHHNTDLRINDLAFNAEKGDRILVLKWTYDIGLPGLGPKRWDVTVFKDPADGTTNFIKRLVGLPNEALVILDGDVFAAPLNELSEETLAEFAAMRQEKYALRTGAHRGYLPQLSAAARADLDAALRIARKSEEAQDALWQLVYNHDYPPRRLDPHQPRWQPGRGEETGWDADQPLVSFADQGFAEDFIVLAGKRIAADNAYNIFTRPAAAVSDQRVSLVFDPHQPDAELYIRLEKLGRVFWAHLRADGLVRLVEAGGDDPTSSQARVLAERTLRGFGTGAHKVAFENVDYRLNLSVDDETVLSSSDDPKSPAFYGPVVGMLRNQWNVHAAPPPRIYGVAGSFTLAHLLVERDVYYFHDPASQGLALPWGPRGGWASPESPILLGADEYFMLGDNTTASKDSRLWDVVGPHMARRAGAFQLGTVPGDQLIGRAFFVYWPQPHRIPWLPQLRWGIIPDVGNMRWIR